LIETGKPPAAIIKEKNLSQISDEDALEGILEEIIRDNPKSVNDFKAGKNSALMFLVGQAMKKSQGKANPKIVQDMLKRRLIDE
jgi:aspartyl-tRNA(Asn)/glutamyl-tRNA(Gln) amidotransferase subunit B